MLQNFDLPVGIRLRNIYDACKKIRSHFNMASGLYNNVLPQDVLNVVADDG